MRDHPDIACALATGYASFQHQPDDGDDSVIMYAPEEEPEAQESALIYIEQLPIIANRLQGVKGHVDALVAQALELACTEETLQAVKAARRDLNATFQSLEEQRKAVKAAVMEPYNQLDAVYKDCVSDTFRRADTELRGKIGAVESEIKRRCEDGLREYFAELCAANHVEWLAFEQSGVAVDLTSAKQKTPKKLRETLAQFVARVSESVALIADMEEAEEVMVEYKRSLNLHQAVCTVKERNRRIEAEREASAARKAVLEREAEAVAKVQAAAPPEVLAPPVEAAPAAQQEQTYKCGFTVYATKPQLRRLKEFLMQEGIRYE